METNLRLVQPGAFDLDQGTAR